MNFAKNLLEKYGWKEGEGLGKNSDGISKPVKVNYKFDTAGVGHNKADEFTNNWWEKVYNKAADNLDINKNPDGEVSMGLKTGKSVEINTKTYSIKKGKESRKQPYAGIFFQSETRNTGVENNNVSEYVIPPAKIKIVSDRDLLKACKGRTAHKGARHGLNSAGKLARIEAQERELLKQYELAKNQPSTSKDRTIENLSKWTEVSARKQRSKAQKSDEPCSTSTSNNVAPERTANDSDDDDEISKILHKNEYYTGSAKKQKQQRKLDEQLSAAISEITTGITKSPKSDKSSSKTTDLHSIADESKTIKKKKKSKKSHKRKRSRSPITHSMVGRKDEFMKRLSIEELEITFEKRPSRKRRLEDDINWHRSNLDNADDADHDNDCLNDSRTTDDGSVSDRISAQLKCKLGFVAKDKKKIVVENLTDFQKEHFRKSKIPVVEITTTNVRQNDKEEKKFAKLASKFNKKMRLKE